MESEFNFTCQTDEQLINNLQVALAAGHRATAAIVAHLGEVEARKLYLDQACSSMWVYCVERLGLSEPAAFKRLRAARAARRYPSILARLARGEIHLTAVSMVAPHLTTENQAGLLDAAARKSKAEVERLLAEWFPQPDTLPSVRKLPARNAANAGPGTFALLPGPKTGGQQETAGRVAAAGRLTPTAPERYKVQFTAGRGLHDKIKEARDLMRHRSPDGNFERLFEDAVDLLLVKLRQEKFATTAKSRRPKPRKASVAAKRGRHIPNAIKREVARRDEGRCTFVDSGGNRCGERAFVEFHHAGHAFGRGGEHSPDNLTLFCGPHNRHAADKDYGAAHMERLIHQAKQKGAAAQD